MTTTNNMLTTQRLPHPINNVYEQEFLRRAMGGMPHNMFAKPTTIPANSGDRVSWMRWDNPTAQITPVPEGTDPTPIMPARTTISAQVKEYKAIIKPSRWLDVTGFSKDTMERVQWLADCLAITKDTLARNVLAGAASTITCSHGDGTATLLNDTDIDAAVTRLRGANAMKIKGMIGASTGVGTSPISSAFVGFMHEDLRRDLKLVTGFKEVKDYANPSDAYPDEYGSTGEVRWILTTNGYSSSGNYYSFIIAQEAYGTVSIEEANQPLIYKSPEEAGSPTNAYSTLAYSINDAVRILNDNYLCVLISTKS
jgi:N4-gp56 family major capsid protein